MKIQAETATLSGAVIADNHANAEGNRFVDFINPTGDFVVEYSGGDQIVGLSLNGSGDVVGKRVVADGFNNPLDLTEHLPTGRLYVADSDGITLLEPIDADSGGLSPETIDSTDSLIFGPDAYPDDISVPELFLEDKLTPTQSITNPTPISSITADPSANISRSKTTFDVFDTASNNVAEVATNTGLG